MRECEIARSWLFHCVCVYVCMRLFFLLMAGKDIIRWCVCGTRPLNQRVPSGRTCIYEQEAHTHTHTHKYATASCLQALGVRTLNGPHTRICLVTLVASWLYGYKRISYETYIVRTRIYVISTKYTNAFDFVAVENERLGALRLYAWLLTGMCCYIRRVLDASIDIYVYVEQQYQQQQHAHSTFTHT